MNSRFRNNTAVSAFIISLAMHCQSFASILDTDPNCRQNGCAVISYDANRFVVYDTVEQDGTPVAAGAPLRARFSTPEFLNVTGTFSPATIPDENHGMILGISQNGTIVDQTLSDNDLDGFLDAGDDFGRTFSVSGTTDIVLDGKSQSYTHSFYITSRGTPMSLRARISEARFSDDFNTTLNLSDISLTPSVSSQGNDGGFNYGRRANGGNITIEPTITNLGDLSSTSSSLIQFGRRQGIAKRNADLDEQSIRVDFLYTMPPYDFSMGIGAINVTLEFELYNEQQNGNGGNNGNNGNNGNTGNNGNNGNPPGPNENANPNAGRNR